MESANNTDNPKNEANKTEEDKTKEGNPNNNNSEYNVSDYEADFVYVKKEYEYVHDFEFTQEKQDELKKIIEENSEPIPEDPKINTQSRNWDIFYKYNKTNFFKDRHYIINEFPELQEDKSDEITLLDIGCGVGNSFYPILKHIPKLRVYAFDFSKRAVNMAKTHPLYNENKIKLDALDIVNDELPYPKCNYGILMFVLSAIKPEDHEKVINKIKDHLNTGAVLYFRDYARYDMTQVRFAMRKKNKVGENLYMRKDKTLSYFFDQKEIEELFKSCGFSVIESKLICRIIENRKENKVMHRLWLQIKLRKE